MKAAVVNQAGSIPIFADFRDPEPKGGEWVVQVAASSLSHVTKSRASGDHYSSDADLPFVPGVDGVGVTQDGRRIYFLMPTSPFGAMAERCLVDPKLTAELPSELTDEKAAAMAIPGMSSWAALRERAHLSRGETVLINGATGTSGRLAVQIAKHLGAKQVIATGRDLDTLEAVRGLGADSVLNLTQDADSMMLEMRSVFEAGVDIVLDYLWGNSAQTLLSAAATSKRKSARLRFVQIGSASGPDITLKSGVLRSTAIQLLGSGIGSIALPKLFEACKGVLQSAISGGFEVETQTMPLAEVERAWSLKDGSRVVLVP